MIKYLSGPLLATICIFLHLNALSQTDSVIRNQLSAAQDANFWIKGRGLVGATSDLYPQYNFQVFGKTWLDHFVHMDFGANFANRSVVVDGNTMGGYVPLHVNGNADGHGIELEDGLFRFIRTNDLYENENYSGGGSNLVFRYPYGAIPYIQRNGHDYTILALQSPPSELNAWETTLALINGDNSEEYLDLYNLSYPSSKKFGVRMQKRSTGAYKPFVFEYSDGDVVYPVMQLSPDTSASFYGRVGVGTTDTKGYMLAVAGAVAVERLQVKHHDFWPDFVFSPGYKLPALGKVEKFIRQNAHLPEMPSAAEVAEKGVDVAEINAKLLQKVEELTLYLIRQEKEISALKKEVKNLKGSIQKHQ
ncbi:hypothetical protein [Chitinophaga sp. YIM B06452]|uniref:hypothetical protein n=1 Tax=Chitinophaga sp. YIM B06452 TaxID=3082158 RepID=UPI0031FE4F9B